MTEKDMISCSQCSSYLNPYCQYNYSTGQWICPICQCENNSHLDYNYDETKHQHILGSEVVEYHHQIDTPSNSSPSMNGAMLSPLTVLVIDGNLPPEEVQSIFQSLSSLLQCTKSEEKIALIIYTSNIHIYQLGMLHGIETTTSSADVYSFHQCSDIRSRSHNDDDRRVPYDEYYDEEVDVIHVKELENKEDRMYVGSFQQARLCASSYFGFRYDEDTSVSANTTTTTTTTSYNEKDLYTMQQQQQHPLQERQDQPQNGGISQPTQKKLSRTEMLRLKRINRQRQKETNQHLDLDECTPEEAAQYLTTTIWSKKKNVPMKTKKRRCTGEAVAHAYTLITAENARNHSTHRSLDPYSPNYNKTNDRGGRVLVFTNGCCNYGKGTVIERSDNDDDHFEDGHSQGLSPNNKGDIIDPIQLQNAAKYFYQVGKESFDAGIGIDVFCSGNSSTIGSQAFLSLVKCSSGYVLSHVDFKGSQFDQNLEYVLSSTSMVGGGNDNVNGCLLDIRMPRYVH